MKSNQTKAITTILGVAVLAVGVLLFLGSRGGSVGASYDTTALAQCLAAKKVTMYGASWCPHCQAQEALFGDAFKLVPYVECPNNPQQCLAIGVQGYPTWILPNGQKLAGEQQLPVLAQTTGCPLTAK